MDFNAWRRRRISDPAYRWARGAMPGLSDTEREAIEAGDVWWDADLFTGDPDWNKLLAVPQATLTEAEQQFLDGPRSEERRVGKECGSTCRSRWSPCP